METTFLLVDDDKNDELFVRQAFQSANECRLEVVYDGQEAIDYLLGKDKYSDCVTHPLPHVILLDLKMPRVNGFEFLEWLHKDSPGDLRLTPVVVMSSSDHPRDVKLAYSLGANSYLDKPIKWSAFQERMKALNIFWTRHVEKPFVSA